MSCGSTLAPRRVFLWISDAPTSPSVLTAGCWHYGVTPLYLAYFVCVVARWSSDLFFCPHKAAGYFFLRAKGNGEIDFLLEWILSPVGCVLGVKFFSVSLVLSGRETCYKVYLISQDIIQESKVQIFLTS